MSRRPFSVEAPASPIRRCGAADFERCGCFGPGEPLGWDGAECSGVVRFAAGFDEFSTAEGIDEAPLALPPRIAPVLVSSSSVRFLANTCPPFVPGCGWLARWRSPPAAISNG